MRHSIIPLFIPHLGCPHRCVFCNQVRITGETTPVTPLEIEETIRRYVETVTEPRMWEAAFYGGSFTALPLAVMEALLAPASEALRRGAIQGIRLSTRPDCIDEARLSLLARSGVETVELGVQSLDDAVLSAAERGHTAGDVRRAVALLRAHGFRVGLQFMQGLPGESFASLRRTARRGWALSPDFIRLYPVLVLADTKLCEDFRRGTYRPLTLSEAVGRCAFLKRAFARRGIPVIRMGLQATAELDGADTLVAGPYHPAFGELVDQYLAKHALQKALRTFRGETEITIFCAPQDRSKIAGYKKSTIRALEAASGARFLIKEEKNILPGTVRIFAGSGRDVKMTFEEAVSTETREEAGGAR